jgi:hypothetical protein
MLKKFSKNSFEWAISTTHEKVTGGARVFLIPAPHMVQLLLVELFVQF